MTSLRSNLPGLTSASSSACALFVAAITIMPSELLKPSISFKRAVIIVFISLPAAELSLLREEPTPSISSMKITQGLFAFALLKSLRTFDEPAPTRELLNSLAFTAIKLTPVSPAKARAIRVLPLPGGPSRRIPFGSLAPLSLYFALFRPFPQHRKILS